MITFDVGVILPAAGSSSRFGGPTPKQYCKVLGKPLFMYALNEFEQLPWVRRIALVVDDPEFVTENQVMKEKVLVVKGESTRHRSIRAGLQALLKNDACVRVVIVHDAARPFIPQILLRQLVLAADSHGAAGAICPLVSTVLKPNSCGFLDQSLDRTTYVSSETPQAFRLNVLSTAYKKISEEDLEYGTECLQLALTYSGVNARLIPGTEELWKVTYKKDLYAAIGCLREKLNLVCIIANDENEAVQAVSKALKPKVSLVEQVLTSLNADSIKTKEIFNNIIFFHIHEIDQDNQFLDFASMLNIDRQGLIVHVIEHSNADGMQNMSVYDLHRSGQNMARHYEKLHKGVIVIHFLSPGEDERLAELVCNLILSDSHTFSGQTMFV